MKWSPLVALPVLILFASCAEPPSQAPDVYRDCPQPVGRSTDAVLEVCGRIDATMAQAVISQLRSTDKEVVLTSGGGFAPPAIALAKAFNEGGITVRVRGFCLSACSTDLLLLVRKVVAEPGTLIAFHHTAAFSLEAAAYRSRRAVSPSVLQPAVDERAGFAEQGLDGALLDRIGMAVEPTCFGLRRTAQGRERYMNYRWAWFVPTRAEAEVMFRGRLSGFWPSSAQEAEEMLRSIGGDRGMRVNYGVLPPPSTPESIAATLPTCPGSLPEWPPQRG